MGYLNSHISGYSYRPQFGPEIRGIRHCLGTECQKKHDVSQRIIQGTLIYIAKTETLSVYNVT